MSELIAVPIIGHKRLPTNFLKYNRDSRRDVPMNACPIVVVRREYRIVCCEGLATQCFHQIRS